MRVIAMHRASQSISPARAPEPITEWQFQLASTSGWQTPHDLSRIATAESGGPLQNVCSQPANTSAMKALLTGELTQRHHAEQYPSWPARQARNIVGAKQLLPGWERFIDPFGKKDVLRTSGRTFGLFGRGIFRAHKRPSCVVPVV
jgi:hypothetical protein